jgi:hypothetical protein
LLTKIIYFSSSNKTRTARPKYSKTIQKHHFSFKFLNINFLPAYGLKSPSKNNSKYNPKRNQTNPKSAHKKQKILKSKPKTVDSRRAKASILSLFVFSSKGRGSR